MVNTNTLTNDMDVLGCKGCCNYPNGKMGIAAVCVSVIGFILATSATYTCNFFKVEMDDYGYSSNLNIGLFSFVDTMGCVGYGSYDMEFSAAWKFARAMAILATILGTTALVGTLSLSCMRMPNLIFKIISIFYLISALCVILTLVMKTDCGVDYNGNNLCKIGPGAALAIVAPFFYVTSAIIVYTIPLYETIENETKPTKPEQSPRTNVMIEITELPDGTMRTVKTSIDENGNKTVEVTIEEPPEKLYPAEEVVLETTRATSDEDGRKVVTETLKPAGKYGEWGI